MENLQYLSLVSKVCTELANHVGIGDKTLAEFIISIAEEAEDLSSFQRKLEENGAEFADSFVCSLHAMILRLRPKKAAGSAGDSGASKASGGGGRSGDQKTEKFPGLSIPDSKPVQLSPPPEPKREPSPPPEKSRDRRDDRGGDRDRVDRR
eukprot:CAMPEP_0169437304 /NCGR_PEP_ID=MMETSP1042-20121227/6059_1 /TAXON_ID=464988 /ORGANISM="Hemiselmis andersenii, Strain CCMP1180" /LENGTH=150 /DNA_ID=CAMNT_0009548073 /DNA_START=126 /DNA_END=574 /DNA_ORIENTATION=+